MWLVVGLVWMVFLVVLFGQRPNYFLVDDNINFFLPNYWHNFRSVVFERTIPLVNLHQLGGNIHLGQGQVGVFYWPVYVAFLVSKLVFGDYFQSISILALFHFGLGVWGMVRLVSDEDGKDVSNPGRSRLFAWRSRGLPNLGWLAGLLWISFPFVWMVSQSWVFEAYLVGWLPWVFWGIDNQEKHKKASTVYLIAKLHLLLQGYIQWVVMVSFFEALWLGINKSRLKKWKWWVTQNLWVGFLGAVVWMPMMEMVRNSLARSGRLSFPEFVTGRVEWWSFLKTQVGLFDWNGIYGTGSYVFFVGSLLFALWWFRKSWKKNRRLLVMAVLALVASTKLWGVVYWVPILNWFRNPYKNFLMVIFFGVWWVGKRFVDGKWRIADGLVLILMMSVNLGVVLSKLEPRFSFSQDRLVWPVDQEENVLEGLDTKLWRVVGYKLGQESSMEKISHNWATWWGVNHLGGYDVTQPHQTYQATWGMPDSGSVEQEMSQKWLDHLSEWSVKYMITTKRGAEELEKWGLDKIKEDRGLVVMENEKAKRIVEGSGVEVEGVKMGVNGMGLKVEGEGELVFGLVPVSEWGAKVDGEDKVLSGQFDEKAGFRVLVPEGSEEVELRYELFEYRLGTWISGLVIGWWLISVLQVKICK